jgi:hypothetical protein
VVAIATKQSIFFMINVFINEQEFVFDLLLNNSIFNAVCQVKKPSLIAKGGLGVIGFF